MGEPASALSVGLEIAVGLASFGVSVAAGALTLKQASWVLAQYPQEIRSREDCKERYARVLEPFPYRKAIASYVREGWTLCFIVFFAVLAVADFTMGFRVLLAALLALMWATVDGRTRHLREAEFAATLGWSGEMSRFVRARVWATYWILWFGVWFGWTLGCAFVGSALAAPFN